jgi:hypothetical protein
MEQGHSFLLKSSLVPSTSQLMPSPVPSLLILLCYVQQVHVRLYSLPGGKGADQII